MRRLICGAAVLLVMGACRGSQTQLTTPVPAPVTSATEWAATLAQASREARDGRFTIADKLLADFSSRNASAAEAPEAMYWRALYRLDPANQGASARDAAALFDMYLTSGHTSRRNEAATLRRVAGTLEASASASSSATAPRSETVRTDDKAKEEELARLRDELAKANAELERIKRRLAQPKP